MHVQCKEGEVLRVLGMVAVQGYLSWCIDGPFARLENRELLLRVGNGTHHVICGISCTVSPTRA